MPTTGTTPPSRPASPRLPLASLALLASSCIRTAPQAGPAAPSAERPETRTTYSETVEHFVEHPPLVAGQPATFAAHATDIRGDWRPIAEGSLAVVALRGAELVAQSAAVNPSRPGVFTPVLTVPSAGPVELRIRLETPGLRDEASVGEAAVRSTEAEATAAPSPKREETTEAITFLKEEQWRIDFRSDPAARRDLAETLRVPARVLPRPDGRALVAAPVAGRVMPPTGGSFPRLGERLERGAIAGTVSPVLGGPEGTQALAARAQLEARAIEVETEVGRARARLTRAEKILKRVERLSNTGALSERETDDARFEAELAASDLAAAEKLREPFLEVRRREEGGAVFPAVPLRTPIAGTVVLACATTGEHVDAGRLLFELADLARLWIEGEVPEPDLPRLPEKPRAAWAPAAPPGAPPGAGSLDFVAVAPAIDPEKRSARVLFECKNPDGALRIGAAVDLLIETRRAESALAVPESALVDEDGLSVVFVQKGGESFERRAVRTGLRSAGHVQVLAGLEAGERVVTKGAYTVRLRSVSGAIPAHGHDH